MAVYDESRTAAVADQAVQQKLSTARNRIVPRKLAEFDSLRKQYVHVFNVGPWQQIINTGSTGTYTMPGCPEDEDYVELLITDENGDLVPAIPAIVEELVIKSEDEYTRLEESGREFANSMLGLGRGQAPAYALTRFGLFVAKGEKPTAAERKAANVELEKECTKLYKQASDLYATDRALFARVIRPEVHFVAAKVLGRDNEVDSPWMTAAAPMGRVKCGLCGRVVDAGIAMCEGGHIVNAEAYEAAMKQQEAIKARK